MNHNDRFIGQLEDYLDTFDGVTPLPDRVRDAIHAELPSARQVQPRPGLLRVFTMLSNVSAGTRMGLAAAAIVAVVVLGATAILNRDRDEGVGGPGPASSPQTTAPPSLAPTSSPTPSVAAVPPPLEVASYVACDSTDPGKDCLPAGTYQLSGGSGVWPVKVTIDVPAGWFEWEGGTGWDAVLVGRADVGSGWGAMFYTVADVARDPCDSTKGWIPAAQVDTPQKLATAMAAWPRFTATTPKPITLDGHSGLKFQLTSTANGSCGNGSAGHSTSGASVDVYPTVDSSGAHDPATVEIVDTGHGLLVMRATDFPQTSPAELDGGRSPDPSAHAGDLAGLHAILDSIRISDWPPSP